MELSINQTESDDCDENEKRSGEIAGITRGVARSGQSIKIMGMAQRSGSALTQAKTRSMRQLFRRQIPARRVVRASDSASNAIDIVTIASETIPDAPIKKNKKKSGVNKVTRTGGSQKSRKGKAGNNKSARKTLIKPSNLPFSIKINNLPVFAISKCAMYDDD